MKDLLCFLSHRDFAKWPFRRNTMWNGGPVKICRDCGRAEVIALIPTKEEIVKCL